MIRSIFAYRGESSMVYGSIKYKINTLYLTVTKMARVKKNKTVNLNRDLRKHKGFWE